MSLDRRAFLGLAGLSALAAAGTGAVRALAGAAPEAETGSRTRWALAVDLRKCRDRQGCTACLEACDRAHNVPRLPERAHEVKWIWKEPFERALPDHGNPSGESVFAARPVPVLCNHCDNPPCTRVCPVQATWKRGDGIVMMDWHRCIGCRYCMAACPYGARSFNWRDPRPYIEAFNAAFPTRTRGVVEMCNFCEERLAQGKGPACVEACSEQALVFGNLADPRSELSRLLRERYALRRRPELGTRPNVYYLV